MEAATLTPSALGLTSFDRPGRCEPVVPRDRESSGCGGRRRSASAGAETSVAALRYRRSERTALYIETQEGDIVRLRIKVRSALDAEVAGMQGEVALEEIDVSARYAAKFSFSVEGDLNAEELAAIRSVVAQASGLAAELFAGDTTRAFATAAALEIDGVELARVGLRLSVREHLTYSYRSAPAPLPAPEPEQPEPSPSQPTTDAPSGGTDAPSGGTSAPALAAPAAPSDAAVSTTERAAEPGEAEPAPAEVRKPATAQDFTAAALDTIAKFLAQLLDALAEPAPPADGDAPSIALSLKLRVFKSMALTLAEAQVSAPEEMESGVPLLADTLDALAAHEEPLDARA